MTKNIALVYASHDGHTKTICETIKNNIMAIADSDSGTDAVSVDLLLVSEIAITDLENYNFLVFASPIRYGRHLKPVVNFLKTHSDYLQTQQTAFFSVNITARKAHRNTPETSNYVKKFLAQLSWRPTVVDVFAGKLDYPNYRWFDKYIIRFIMWLTKGPTDLNTVKVFTDWKRVQQFSQRLYELM